MKLEDALPQEEQIEDENIINYGDLIIYTFIVGNYVFGIDKMYKEHFTPEMLNDYIEKMIEEYSLERKQFENDKFNIAFFIELTTDLKNIEIADLYTIKTI